MELYISTIEDPGFRPNKVDIEDEILQLITQIETLLFTNKGEVLNDMNFGVDLEGMIYSFHWNEYQIRGEVARQIERYIPLADEYNIEVDVEFSRGQIRDIAQLNITIDTQYMIGVKIQ